MNKKNNFFVIRENQVSGPFSPSSIKNKIQNGAVGVGDHVGRTESGPWKKVGEVPSLAALIPAEPTGDEWDEPVVESEAYSPPARQRPPQFDPVSEPGVPLSLWSIRGAVAVLIVGAVVGGFYLATGDRSGEPVDVSAHDARNLRARAEWIGETAVALDLIQTWVKKKKTESSGSEGTVTLAGDAEVPGLKDHLTVLTNISGTVTGEPNVGRECQRLTNFLEAYQLRQKNLVTAVAEFTAADPTTIPYDTLETTIGECREFGVPLLKTRADALARVVAVARDDNAAVARLQKMDGLEFQKATSLRPAVSKGSEPELMALARFFANNKNTDVALVDREEVRLENIESIRARNEKSTATRSLYLSNADDYVELGDRHGSRTVVNWHSKSPTYFTPVVPGDEKSFRKIADSLGLSLKASTGSELEVRVSLKMLIRMEKWLKKKHQEKESAQRIQSGNANFLEALDLNIVLAKLKKQVLDGIPQAGEVEPLAFAALWFAGRLKSVDKDGQRELFLDVERIIASRNPNLATAASNRTTIGVSAWIVTEKDAFGVSMSNIKMTPLAKAALGIESHFVPPTDGRKGLSEIDYVETFIRGNKTKIEEVNKRVRTWLLAAIRSRNDAMPSQQMLEERVQSLVGGGKKAKANATRLARVLRAGSGMRLYERSVSILEGSRSTREDVVSAARFDAHFGRTVPASVRKYFEDQVLGSRLVVAVASDGVFLLTGKEAVGSVRKLLRQTGIYADQKKDNLVMKQAREYYSKYTPSIRRPTIPSPPPDPTLPTGPLYPRMEAMPSPPRGGPKTITKMVKLSRNEVAARRKAIDARIEARRIGAEFGAPYNYEQKQADILAKFNIKSVGTRTVLNPNYAGDAAWTRYRANVRSVQERHRTAVATQKSRIAKGGYDNNPTWQMYQSDLSKWNEDKAATIAAWQKRTDGLLAAWTGGGQQRILAAIIDLQNKRRKQAFEIRNAIAELQSNARIPKGTEVGGAEGATKLPVTLVPSIEALLSE